MRRAFSLLLLLLLPPSSAAGVHCSHERIAELPSEWRGLLADLRLLRGAAASTGPASALRQQWLDAARALQAKSKQADLSAEEAADLGALLLRLGKADEALGLLRNAQAKHPENFGLAANLGTAWQANGDLRRAEEQLRLAVRLAPDEKKSAERLHLRWVQRRLAEPAGQQLLDDLFGLAEKKPWP